MQISIYCSCLQVKSHYHLVGSQLPCEKLTTSNPIPRISNNPQKPSLSRGFAPIWDHKMGLIHISAYPKFIPERLQQKDEKSQGMAGKRYFFLHVSPSFHLGSTWWTPHPWCQEVASNSDTRVVVTVLPLGQICRIYNARSHETSEVLFSVGGGLLPHNTWDF